MIVGLVGYIGAGKSTVAHILATQYDMERMSFAGPLKNICADMLHTAEPTYLRAAQIREAMDDPQRKRTYRALLQWYGQYMRDLDPDYWVKQMRESLRGLDVLNPVIDDVRYPNEAQMLLDRGAVLVRVKRSVADEEARLGTLLHESEQHVLTLPVTHYIDNNGSLGDLDLMVRRLMEELY